MVGVQPGPAQSGAAAGVVRRAPLERRRETGIFGCMHSDDDSEPADDSEPEMAGAAGRVMAFGEALVEFMPATPGQSMAEAVTWTKFAGGAPATYAAALARLGRPAALWTRVGDDPFSDFVVDACAAEGIDTAWMRRTPGRQLGLCFHELVEGRVHLRFERGASAATVLAPDDIDAAALTGAAALHVTGTALQISDSARAATRAALAAARDAGLVVSFDPNIRVLPGAADAAAAFDEALAAADLVMPTRREAATITGLDDPAAAALELRARGPRLVAVTLGPEGCWILGPDDREPHHCPGYAVDVVEPTGSGDCHAAAMMAGFLAGWDAPRIGAYANAAGAIAVTAMGHFGGALPTPARIEALLSRARS